MPFGFLALQRKTAFLSAFICLGSTLLDGTFQFAYSKGDIERDVYRDSNRKIYFRNTTRAQIEEEITNLETRLQAIEKLKIRSEINKANYRKMHLEVSNQLKQAKVEKLQFDTAERERTRVAQLLEEEKRLGPNSKLGQAEARKLTPLEKANEDYLVEKRLEKLLGKNPKAEVLQREEPGARKLQKAEAIAREEQASELKKQFNEIQREHQTRVENYKAKNPLPEGSVPDPSAPRKSALKSPEVRGETQKKGVQFPEGIKEDSGHSRKKTPKTKEEVTEKWKETYLHDDKVSTRPMAGKSSAEIRTEVHKQEQIHKTETTQLENQHMREDALFEKKYANSPLKEDARRALTRQQMQESHELQMKHAQTKMELETKFENKLTTGRLNSIDKSRLSEVEKNNYKSNIQFDHESNLESIQRSNKSNMSDINDRMKFYEEKEPTSEIDDFSKVKNDLEAKVGKRNFEKIDQDLKSLKKEAASIKETSLKVSPTEGKPNKPLPSTPGKKVFDTGSEKGLKSLNSAHAEELKKLEDTHRAQQQSMINRHMKEIQDIKEEYKTGKLTEAEFRSRTKAFNTKQAEEKSDLIRFQTKEQSRVQTRQTRERIEVRRELRASEAKSTPPKSGKTVQISTPEAHKPNLSGIDHIPVGTAPNKTPITRKDIILNFLEPNEGNRDLSKALQVKLDKPGRETVIINIKDLDKLPPEEMNKLKSLKGFSGDTKIHILGHGSPGSSSIAALEDGGARFESKDIAKFLSNPENGLTKAGSKAKISVYACSGGVSDLGNEGKMMKSFGENLSKDLSKNGVASQLSARTGTVIADHTSGKLLVVPTELSDFELSQIDRKLIAELEKPKFAHLPTAEKVDLFNEMKKTEFDAIREKKGLGEKIRWNREAQLPDGTKGSKQVEMVSKKGERFSGKSLEEKHKFEIETREKLNQQELNLVEADKKTYVDQTKLKAAEEGWSKEKTASRVKSAENLYDTEREKLLKIQKEKMDKLLNKHAQERKLASADPSSSAAKGEKTNPKSLAEKHDFEINEKMSQHQLEQNALEAKRKENIAAIDELGKKKGLPESKIQQSKQVTDYKYKQMKNELSEKQAKELQQLMEKHDQEKAVASHGDAMKKEQPPLESKKVTPDKAAAKSAHVEEDFFPKNGQLNSKGEAMRLDAMDTKVKDRGVPKAEIDTPDSPPKSKNPIASENPLEKAKKDLDSIAPKKEIAAENSLEKAKKDLESVAPKPREAPPAGEATKVADSKASVAAVEAPVAPKKDLPPPPAKKASAPEPLKAEAPEAKSAAAAEVAEAKPAAAEVAEAKPAAPEAPKRVAPKKDLPPPPAKKAPAPEPLKAEAPEAPKPAAAAEVAEAKPPASEAIKMDAPEAPKPPAPEAPKPAAPEAKPPAGKVAEAKPAAPEAPKAAAPEGPEGPLSPDEEAPMAEDAAKKKKDKYDSNSCITAAVFAAQVTTRGIALPHLLEAHGKACEDVKNLYRSMMQSDLNQITSAKNKGANPLDDGTSAQAQSNNANDPTSPSSSSSSQNKAPSDTPLALYSQLDSVQNCNGNSSSICSTVNSPIFAEAATAGESVLLKNLGGASGAMSALPGGLGSLVKTIHTQGAAAGLSTLVPPELGEAGLKFAEIGNISPAGVEQMASVFKLRGLSGVSMNALASRRGSSKSTDHTPNGISPSTPGNPASPETLSRENADVVGDDILHKNTSMNIFQIVSSRISKVSQRLFAPPPPKSRTY